MKITINDVEKLGFKFDTHNINNIDQVLENISNYIEESESSEVTAALLYEAVTVSRYNLNLCCNCNTITKTHILYWEEDLYEEVDFINNGNREMVLKNMKAHDTSALCDDCLELFSQENVPQDKIGKSNNLVEHYVKFIASIEYKNISKDFFEEFITDGSDIKKCIETFGHAKEFKTYLDSNNIVHSFTPGDYNHLFRGKVEDYLQSLDIEIEKINKIAAEHGGLTCCDNVEKETLENVSFALGNLLSRY